MALAPLAAAPATIHHPRELRPAEKWCRARPRVAVARYEWGTEGFDMRDPKDAKAPLDELR